MGRAGSASLSSGVRVAGGAVSLVGVAPVPAAFDSNSGNSGSPTVSLSLVGNPDNLIVDTLAVNGDAGSATASGGLLGSPVERWNVSTGSSNGDIIGAGSTQAPALLLESSDWSLGTNRPWSLAVVTLARAGC